MKKFVHILVWAVLAMPLAVFASTSNKQTEQQATTESLIKETYNKVGLKGQLDFEVYRDAYIAYDSAKDRRKSLLTIIDYSRPSTEKRFFVIDLDKQELLYNTYVSHGVNSGGKTATKFSNVVNSRKTSLGTFLTDDTYYGGNGYSLRLDGLSKGKNDRARERYIVVHGADYATESFIKQNGYLGRSWGCPALPPELARDIIDLIKDGSVIYATA
ncbi:murein L,D-transpeptidase catalytic domain family protein [Vibrio astriarenae]|uniref:murein L,D-transpeptidase catalytic domain family protein n=1 Tax=Vibrio astriarenae TaxID=1481923 RepID=UPI003736830B